MKSLWGFLVFCYFTLVIADVYGTDFMDRSPHYRLSFIKREAQGVIGANEGEIAKTPITNQPLPAPINETANKPPEANKTPEANKHDVQKLESTNVTNAVATTLTNSTAGLPLSKLPLNNSTVVVNGTNVNITATETVPTVDLKNPGVLKRGLIVFGAFTLLGVVYYIFYRKRNSKSDCNNTSTGDNNQFRYGVLHSDDRRDNLELSRIPLTIESDDDDDEDLEVFDIEERRKNMTYVNLQTNDLDIVNPQNIEKKNDSDYLLLDIDDTSDTSMNWMQSSSKSIL